MRYLGGKFRIAKQISEVLKSYQEDGQVYVEPFVGAGWVLAEMEGVRQASDINPYLIAMYLELQKGWIPPDGVSEGMYLWAKNDECPDYLKGFIGFGCSWGGKWFGGYARGGEGRDYSLNAKRSLLCLYPKLSGVCFRAVSYVDLSPSGCLIYCDPPYADTTEYDFCGKFDSIRFWDVMRCWSKSNTVIVSGYECPSDFMTIFEMPTRTDIRDKSGKMSVRTERLFKYKKG